MAPGIFPYWQIALDAGIAFLVALVVEVALYQRSKPAPPMIESVLVALVVGLSVLAWRSFANVAPLNNDPVPPVSPNDALSPIVTYVALGWYAAFRPPRDAARWERERVLLAAVSFVVNVIAI